MNKGIKKLTAIGLGLLFCSISIISAQMNTDNNEASLPDSTLVNDSTITAIRLNTYPINNISNALTGKQSGLYVKNISSEPGANSDIYIRGIGSVIFNNNPLVIIDGTPGASYTEIDLNNIESVKIIKDIASLSRYGTMGSNGIIEINTKRGQANYNKVEFNVSYGVQAISNRQEALNSTQAMELFRDMLHTVSPDDSTNYARYYWGSENISGLLIDTANLSDHDWQDDILRISNLQNYSFAVNSGSEKISFRLTGNYYNREGIIKSSDFKKYLFRLNIDYKPTQKLTFVSNLSFMRTAKNYVPIGDNLYKDNLVLAALLTPPMLPNLEFDDFFVNPMQPMVDNPNARISGNKRAEEYETSFTGSFGLNYEIKKNFSYSFNGYSKAGILKADSYLSRYDTYYGRKNQGIGKSSINEFTLLNLHNSLTYNIENENHRFRASVSFILQNSSLKPHIAISNTYATDNIQLVAGKGLQEGANNSFTYENLSFLESIEYTLADKYVINLLLRSDKSSFYKTDTWKYFPSAQIAWNMANESFFENTPRVSQLNLFAGYGISGNDGGYWNGNNYPQSAHYIKDVYNDSIEENTDRKIEKTKEINMGIDIGLFDQRVQLLAQYYNKSTTDLLLPQFTNDSLLLYRNIGEVRNSGFEIDLTLQLINRKSICWYSNFMLTTQSSELASLNNYNDNIQHYIYPYHTFRKGESIFSFYGYKTDGIFQNVNQIADSPFQSDETQPGDIRFKDINGDHIIDEKDQTIIGSLLPDFYFGFENTLILDQFELNFLIQGAYGQEVLNLTRTETGGMYDWLNQSTEVLKRWESEGQSTEIPRAVFGDPNQNNRVSDRFIEDGSFIKLEYLNLGYNIPSKMLQDIGIKKLKIYINAQNLFCLTKYKGYDPESSTMGLLNVDYGSYPASRYFGGGLCLSF